VEGQEVDGLERKRKYPRTAPVEEYDHHQILSYDEWRSSSHSHSSSSDTTTSTNGGPARSVNDHHMATLLVADTDSAEEGNTVAVIAVDKRTGNVSGIVNKENGEKFNFFQENGNKVRFTVLLSWIMGVLFLICIRIVCSQLMHNEYHPIPLHTHHAVGGGQGCQVRPTRVEMR
jgi:hypothetical protein